MAPFAHDVLWMNSAFAKYQGDVILLVSAAKSTHLVCNGFDHGLAALIAILMQPLNEVLLSELFAAFV